MPIKIQMKSSQAPDMGAFWFPKVPNVGEYVLVPVTKDSQARMWLVSRVTYIPIDAREAWREDAVTVEIAVNQVAGGTTPA